MQWLERRLDADLEFYEAMKANNIVINRWRSSFDESSEGYWDR